MRLTAIAGFAAGLTIALTATAQAGSLDDIKARGELICGVVGVNEPFGFEDVKTREVTGYEVDLCKILAQKLGVKINIRVVTSQSRVPELVQKRIDMLSALLSYTKERAEQVDFSQNYLSDFSRCMVASDSKIQKLDELNGARVAILKGSVLDAPFRAKVPKATVLLMDDTAISLLSLYQGKVDATCNRVSTLSLLDSRNANRIPTRYLPETVIFQTAGFAVRKGEKEFVAYLNNFLEGLETSGEGQKLWDKWLGTESPMKLKREFKFGGPLE
jgi:polar amino acid transport system substrate-binding protein